VAIAEEDAVTGERIDPATKYAFGRGVGWKPGLSFGDIEAGPTVTSRAGGKVQKSEAGQESRIEEFVGQRLNRLATNEEGRIGNASDLSSFVWNADKHADGSLFRLENNGALTGSVDVEGGGLGEVVFASAHSHLRVLFEKSAERSHPIGSNEDVALDDRNEIAMRSSVTSTHAFGETARFPQANEVDPRKAFDDCAGVVAGSVVDNDDFAACLLAQSFKATSQSTSGIAINDEDRDRGCRHSRARC